MLIESKDMMNETFTLNRMEYEDLKFRIDQLNESKGIDTPYLVEHDFVLDTFEVTLLHKSYNLNYIMGV
tara:strand:+ start:444 stop:650 length:207 start_codon:yes stop_codon:yes gene_type:complete